MQAQPEPAQDSPSAAFGEVKSSRLAEVYANPYLPEQQLQQALDPEQPTQPTALAARGTKRGRKPQDPNQIIVRADCPSQEVFEHSLRAFLDDDSYDRHHVLFEGTFPVSAAFLVDYGPAAVGKAKSNSYKYGPAFAPGLGTSKDGHIARSMSVMEALTMNPEDPKERMRKQRAIARAMENLVERVDGYRYAFHNEWLARDNDAYRFSYFCNDSLLNKDRTLGGVKKNDVGKVKRARKQVYDCQGYLTVKFSATRQCLEVLYKHIPLHMTYDERAPLPRVGTKRFQILEMTDPNHELVRRAREVEARKRFAASAPNEPRKGKRSLESAALAETPARKRRGDNAHLAALSESPDGTRTFQFRNHTLADETAKRQASRPLESGADRLQSEAIARDASEVADLKAKLAAAEQHIQRLQANGQNSPPAWGLGVQPQWYPPYGPGPSPPMPPAQDPKDSRSPPQSQGQLSVRRAQGAGDADGAITAGQPLFQVMQFKQATQKKRRSSAKKTAVEPDGQDTSDWS